MQRSSISRAAEMPPPLTFLPDMASVWSNTDLSFDDAAEMFVSRHRDDGAVRDVPLADLRTWTLQAHENHLALQPLGKRREPLLLRNNGLASLCTRLQVPAEFLRRLAAPLQLAILNWSLCHLDRATPVLLRTRDGAVTAIVSERYAPLEADELVNTLRRALTQHGLLASVRVRAIATGLTDALRLTFPERSVEPALGDVTHAGLDISTSSFAKAAVRARGTLYRLVCTNGLSAPEQMGDFSTRHIGDRQRLRDFLQDAIPAALAHTSGLMSAWRRAVATEIEDLAAFIGSIRELTAPERQLVESRVADEVGARALPDRASVYALVNGMTSAAHEADPARRLELEGLAGRLLVARVGAS